MTTIFSILNDGTIQVVFDCRLQHDCDAFAAVQAPMHTGEWEPNPERLYKEKETFTKKRRHIKEVNVGVKIRFIIWERSCL